MKVNTGWLGCVSGMRVMGVTRSIDWCDKTGGRKKLQWLEISPMRSPAKGGRERESGFVCVLYVKMK